MLGICAEAHVCCGAGIVGMCKEHLGVALALKVPVFFVVTKVDICPSHVLQHSLATLSAILRKPGVKKKPFMVRPLPTCPCSIGRFWQLHEVRCPCNDSGHDIAQVRTREDCLTCARHIHTDSLAPVFLTSSVTGDGLELVRLFYNLLPQRQRWADKVSSHRMSCLSG